jgi:hypothetical protein
VHRLDLSDGYFVVAANLYVGAQFAKVLDEVVSKRIVVIEDKDHRFIVAPGARFLMCGDGAPPPSSGEKPRHHTFPKVLVVSMKKAEAVRAEG